MIHDLKRQGLSVSAIARQTGLDRKTVRKHLAGGVKAPVYKPRPARPRELEPYGGHSVDGTLNNAKGEQSANA